MHVTIHTHSHMYVVFSQIYYIPVELCKHLREQMPVSCLLYVLGTRTLESLDLYYISYDAHLLSLAVCRMIMIA